ncbi:MAG: HEAT repeat domain-containing protein [Gammaproteobacteria bacterium]
MSDRIDEDFAGSGEHNELWNSLGQMSQAEPNRRLRHRVFRAIDAQDGTRWTRGWRAFLPMLPQQIVGLALVAVVSVAVGLFVGRPGIDLDTRIARLEGELTSMNQQLLLSQLTATSPTQRLAAAFQVSGAPQRDAKLADALLQMAVRDPVDSVRTAAITALGDAINQAEVATALFSLLGETESPIVQMAIVDAILRHGTEEAVRRLRGHVETEQLHPSLDGYVTDATEELRI